MEGGRVRLRIRVTGRVQGVGFRWWASSEARALGLAGTVRNVADGSVELEMEGDGAAVRMLRARLQEGPPGATVAAVEEVAASTGELPRPFRIIV